MAKKKKPASTVAAKRSEAARKGWQTRKAEARRAAKEARQRSENARKGWATRRKAEAAKKSPKPSQTLPLTPRAGGGGGGDRGGGGGRMVIPPERFSEIENDWADFDRDDWHDLPDESS